MGVHPKLLLVLDRLTGTTGAEKGEVGKLHLLPRQCMELIHYVLDLLTACASANRLLALK